MLAYERRKRTLSWSSQLCVRRAKAEAMASRPDARREVAQNALPEPREEHVLELGDRWSSDA